MEAPAMPHTPERKLWRYRNAAVYMLHRETVDLMQRHDNQELLRSKNKNDELMQRWLTLVIPVLGFSLFHQLTNELSVRCTHIFFFFVTLPAMMNMMPAVTLILALVESSMLVIVRQVREQTAITAPRTLSTTPTMIRARTAWKAPSRQ